METKNSFIKVLILLFILFQFTKCDIKWIAFVGNFAQIKATKSNKIKSYGVDFGITDLTDLSKLPSYFKIQVTSDDSSPAPFLCFSNIEWNCENRNQISKNPNEKTTFIWVKREEFSENYQDLFIYIECEKDICDYTLTVEGFQIPTFSPNFVYSYLVGKNNREMPFKIQNQEKNEYMTVALEGSSQAQLIIDNRYLDAHIYRNGKIYIFFLEEEGYETISFTIKNAEIGEYLTLSAHLVNNTFPYEGYAPIGFLLPNGPEITGYLKFNLINKECFPLDLSKDEYKSISQFYITGRIYTKYAWFFLEEEQGNHIGESMIEILNGQLSYVIKNNRKLIYICFELPNEYTLKPNRMSFSFSLTEPSSLSSLYNYYPPQLTGEIYRRIIPKGGIAFFSGTKNDITVNKYDYSLYQIKGLTKMYIADCRKYPNCHYSRRELDNLISPKAINQMTIWSTENDKSSAIGQDKYVIVAYCEDDGNDNSGYCEFETSIFSKQQNIYLVEDEQFSKYVLKDEKGRFIADLQNGRNMQLLSFDIMIYTGDVFFNIYSPSNINYHKNYLSNKVHFVITPQNIVDEQIVIEYNALKNSFFTIKYNINEQSVENLLSGESYLVQIDPTSTSKSKNVFLFNKFYKNKNPFLVRFNELNCKFEVKIGNKDLYFFDGYAQEIITKNNEKYNSDRYQFDIKIVEEDLSNYNHKMCMLYISGYEAETIYDREIVISENINQQIIFDYDLKKVRFLYPYTDTNQNLVVYINLVDEANYKINFYGNNNNFKEEIVNKTKIFYLPATDLLDICRENLICPIIVEVEYISSISIIYPLLEVTIRNVKNIPTYLPKDHFKLDFTCGEFYYYLYTDIGKNEEGEITINFLREYGNIWAKVVRKDQIYVDQEANWKGIYRMPSEEWEDSLTFNRYTNKLIINPENTLDCKEGCYLLISIQLSRFDYNEKNIFFPFSILTRFTPSNIAYSEIKKIIIPVDEFIIGNIDISKNNIIYDLYEVWLPHDSNIVEFDLQSSFAGLYINLGGIRPTINNAHFIFLPPGKESILSLTKEEILKKAKDLKLTIPFDNSIQDINLVIGIWTDKAHSIDTELYSFRVHQPKFSEDIQDIILINTEKKIKCNPKFLSQNEYRCLIVVSYDDINTSLLVHGASINQGAISYIYVRYIEKNIYDQYIVKELNNQIPTFLSSDFNSRTDGVDYIYISQLQKNKYIFINIMTNKPDPIMILTSMPTYDYLSNDIYKFYPNPFNEQLLFIQKEKLRLYFPTSDSILVNIITLNGQAEVYWLRDPSKIFYLKGAGDKISLSSGNDVDELIIHRLITDSNVNKLSTMEDPGFVFYISFHLIDPKEENNFIEINSGKPLEIAFKDTEFPIVLYSKIENENKDINIAITFKDNELDQKGEYPFSPFLFSAQVLREKTIYIAKKDKDLSPSIEKSVKGIYDPALKTGQIFLSKEIINAYNINEADNPTLYIRIDKNGDLDEKIFRKFSIEAQIAEINDDSIQVENVYHYGRLKNDSINKIYYRLKVDNNRPYMSIKISFNSDNLDFIVSDRENQNTNITFIYAEKARGKIHLILKINDFKEFIYLSIYKKTESTNVDEHLNNYAFKYINGKDESELFDYNILNSPEISITENTEDNLDNITCIFNKLDINPGKANITYFLKIVDNNNSYFNGEELNTIAVTESPYYTVYERNPKDNNGKISLTARGENLSNWICLNIIAQVQQNDTLEYISYNGKKNK